VFAEPERKFDQVVVRENSFQKQLVGKLSQEVRAAATTTGTVAALREQVGAGEYQVDPHAIARSLLFVWEA
jgi:anti-sigma28 factor (negative regulator of flagellin synthesis)